MPLQTGVKRFRRELGRRLHAWRRGLVLASLCEVALALLATLALGMVLDYFLATATATRLVFSGLAAGAALVWLAMRLRAHFRLGLRDMARRADRLLRHPRHPHLTAVELIASLEPVGNGEHGGKGGRVGATRPFRGDDSRMDPAPGGVLPMQTFLIRQATESAAGELARIPVREAFPRRLVRRRGGALLAAVAVIAVVAGTWRAGPVLLARLALPWVDTPPWSPHQFAIAPEVPAVFYGDDAEVRVEITGAPVEGPVWFQTRTGPGAPISRVASFHDGGATYSQRLEGVVEPIEFSFALGKGRSAWHAVDLRMQPRVALAAATISPPEYTGLPDRSFLVGEEPFAALRGSVARLSLTSNRPLLDGSLRLGEDVVASPVVVGEKSGMQTVTFEWMVESETELTASVRDVRGTEMEEPLLIRQRLVPDLPPKVELVEPPLHLMATPSVRVPVAGRAEDDIGLARMDLARSVVGYRDRLQSASPPNPGRRHEHRFEIDLAALGARPGEILEFFYEAADRNPSLMGLATSEVARVQIIAEDDYAAMIRARTTAEEFAERYRQMEEALRELRESVEELAAAREAGDEEGGDEALARAEEKARDAAGLYEAMSEDFAAFDMESGTIDGASDVLRDIEALQEQLAGAEGRASALSEESLAQMLESIGQREQAASEETRLAEEVESLARLMEMASLYSRMVERQEHLARQLRRFETDTRTAARDLPLLNALREQQEALRGELDDFLVELDRRADALPPAYQDVAEDARGFGRALRETAAAEDMDRSVSAAKAEAGRDSYQHSALAHEKMASLLGDECPASGEGGQFAGLCRGELSFEPGAEGLGRTLQQMLESIRLRQGSGLLPGMSGGGGGGGGGGSGDDGYVVPGFTSLDVPVIGPPRLHLPGGAAPISDSSRSGEGDRAGRVPDEELPVAESDRLQPDTFSDAQGRAGQFDRVPGKYRDAVKRYFTPEGS